MLSSDSSQARIVNESFSNEPVYVRQTYSSEAIEYFESVSADTKTWSRKVSAYASNTTEFLKGVIPEGKTVLIAGCPDWRMIDALNPRLGVAVHPSSKLIAEFKRKCPKPNIKFSSALPAAWGKGYDYIVVLNQIEFCEDLFLFFDELRPLMNERTVLIVSRTNPIWEPLVRFASWTKVRIADFKRNFISNELMQSALKTKGFAYSDEYNRVLIPYGKNWFVRMFNTYVSRLPFFQRLCFQKFTFARLNNVTPKDHLTCSVIIPCFNEEGNVKECALRTPQMGKHTEVLIVDDGSKDRTVAIAKELSKTHPHVRVLEAERNEGKGAAVMRGIAASQGDVVFILDADMTVPPEELNDFFDAIRYDAADFVSGTRFVYPMEKEAMRVANYIGNIFFSKLVELIIGTTCSDTLCGTKVMLRSDFEDLKIKERAWGDFDLIFHAARKKLRMIQVPVHYKSRVAGESKMKAFSSGIKFLGYCLRQWRNVT